MPICRSASNARVPVWKVEIIDTAVGLVEFCKGVVDISTVAWLELRSSNGVCAIAKPSAATSVTRPASCASLTRLDTRDGAAVP